MFVKKRDGSSQEVNFDKITRRLRGLLFGLDAKRVDPNRITQKVVTGVYNGVTTRELDELASRTAAQLLTEHPDYGTLAARICISNLHKTTPKTFSECIQKLYNYVNPKTGKHAPLVSESVFIFVNNHKKILDERVDPKRDFQINYFGFRTLEKTYLLRTYGKIVERPSYMWMRVAVGIHHHHPSEQKSDDSYSSVLKRVCRTYESMSLGLYTHATPTLFNAGTPVPQMSSCFLLCTEEDSIEGIFRTLGKCATISKSAGGVGFSIHKVRAGGSYIRGTNGISNGIIPMLRVFNNTARYVDQGGGRRKGAFAAYLEPWHADVEEFLDLRKNHGAEELRARDLFYALWVPDLFMERVQKNLDWSLFCPDEAPGLCDCYGKNFESLYSRYETEGKARRKLKARKLFQMILDAQVETGTPYMLFKDACNRKSNQRHLGTIRCSNLCSEILEYTAPDEIAVCNLASICLPKFVKTVKQRESRKSSSSSSSGGGVEVSETPETGAKTKLSFFDHKHLFEVTKEVTRNLNQIIDKNFYPVKEAKKSNLRHRPIGIGVQGLADVFIRLRMPFDSEEAMGLNRDIFETIYYGAVTASMELAKTHGRYPSYEGSPASEGKLQFDLWMEEEEKFLGRRKVQLSGRWDWKKLKTEIRRNGLRNSLLVALMPTASTSQIMGNNECFEPYTSNAYVRRTLAGEFVVVNEHLLRELVSLGLWTGTVKNKLILGNGSVQQIEEIPPEIRKLYRTVWEIPGKKILEMAADRSPFVDQSMSLNAHISNVTSKKLTALHLTAWKFGLKTGMYYLRTQAASEAVQFTVQGTAKKEREKEKGSQSCMSCSS